MKVNKETGTIEIEVNNVGVTTLYIPPQYLKSDGTTEDSAIGKYFESLMQEIEDGTRKTLILPQVFDDKGNKYFELVQPTINYSFPNITYIEAVGEMLVGTSEDKQSNKEENNNGN